MMWPIWLCAALCACAAILFIRVSYTGTPKGKLLTKALASLLFLLTGALAAGTPPSGGGRGYYAALMLLGLFFGLCGDVLLECQAVFPAKQKTFFMAGLGVFLIGHVFYIILFFRMAGLSWVPFAAGLGVFLCVLLLKKKFRADPGGMKIPAYAYAAIISLMVGAAFSVLLGGFNLLHGLLMVGSIAFLLSDLFLAYIYFGPKKVAPLRAVNLSLYYFAQILFALSICLR